MWINCSFMQTLMLMFSSLKESLLPCSAVVEYSVLYIFCGAVLDQFDISQISIFEEDRDYEADDVSGTGKYVSSI